MEKKLVQVKKNKRSEKDRWSKMTMLYSTYNKKAGNLARIWGASFSGAPSWSGFRLTAYTSFLKKIVVNNSAYIYVCVYGG